MDTLAILGIIFGSVGTLANISLAAVAIWSLRDSHKQIQAANKQALITQRQTEEGQHNLHRPMLVPKGTLLLKEVNYGVKWPDFVQYESFACPLRNVGAGVATNIQLRLYGSIDQIRTEAHTSWYAFAAPAPLSPDEGEVTCIPHRDTGLFVHEQQIGTHSLAAPAGMAARLILTYHDIFNRKLASIFDYTYAGLWQSVDFPTNIPQDLADLEKERDAAIVQTNQAMLNPAMRPRAIKGPE